MIGSRVVVVGSALLFLWAGAAMAQAPGAEIQRAIGLALQGDAGSAAKTLAGASPTAKDDVQFRACMLERFGGGVAKPELAKIDDPWLAGLAKVYADYWYRALTNPAKRDDAERELETAVGKLLGQPISGDGGFESAQDQIRARAAGTGYHVLLGRTTPLYELMLWNKETVQIREVALPKAVQRVPVHLLDDFKVRGWSHYATCGRRSAAGWTTKDAIYAVVPAYHSLDDEEFLVGLLTHESQHFADKHAVLNLSNWELEYRAKLAEVAVADTSQASTLRRICENRSELKDSPHAYAGYRVMTALGKQLNIAPDQLCQTSVAAVQGQPLRAAAKQILIHDSGRRRGTQIVCLLLALAAATALFWFARRRVLRLIRRNA